MIDKKEVYEVVCDECGESFEDEDRVIYFDTKEEVIEMMSDCDWSIKDDKVFCSNEKCVSAFLREGNSKPK